jgi:hypothetical protein
VKNTKRNFYFRPKYGEVVSPLTNFSMPFHWNNDKQYDWSMSEIVKKEIEKESAWRDYFAQKGDKKQCDISYWKASSMKNKLQGIISKERNTTLELVKKVSA